MDIEWDTNVSGGGEESGWWAWVGVERGVSARALVHGSGRIRPLEAMKLRGIAISQLTKMNKDGQDDRHV